MNLQHTVRVLALVTAIVFVVMGGVAFASAALDIQIRLFLGDPAAIMDGPFYLGAVTMLRTGVLAGAATVCLVTARVLRGRDTQLGEFLLALGLFSAALVLDDQFQGHEVVLGYLGVPQPLTFAAFGAVALAGVWRYGRLILRLHDGGVLLAMFPIFALAVLADTAEGPLFTPFFETAAELAGILCLTFFGIRVSLEALLGVAGDDLPRPSRPG